MTATPESSESGGRSRKLERRLWITALAVVGVLVVALGVIQLSASPAVCGSCHEMKPKVDSWRTSPHSKAGCPSCHEEPRPWYSVAGTLQDRAALFVRDFKAHRAYLAGTVTSASAVTPRVVPDENCLQCHDLTRNVTLQGGILIDHAKHAKRNKSCVSCHKWTAHPAPEAQRSLLLMAECFKCHGRSSTAKAPGTCGTCHPKSFSQRPASHANDWRRRHGKVALADRQQCVMCHDQSFCDNCHGVQMPHPSDWVKGKPGHSTVGAANRQVCAQCHTEKPDLCSMCHHRELQPSSSKPWVEQHPEMVKKAGPSFCMTCHDPMFCFKCHTIGRAIGAP